VHELDRLFAELEELEWLQRQDSKILLSRTKMKKKKQQQKQQTRKQAREEEEKDTQEVSS
jgi:GTP-binding protein EngB required for normal cell division